MMVTVEQVEQVVQRLYHVRHSVLRLVLVETEPPVETALSVVAPVATAH
jgi:hypothetical protein